MKIIKYFCVLITSIVLVVICGIQGLYLYKVSSLNLVKATSTHKYPQVALDALWVALGERDKQKIDSISALGYVFNLVNLVLSNDVRDYEESFPTGLLLSSSVAGKLVFGKTKGNTDWQLSNVVTSIWVSKNYKASEALNLLLDKLYFGYNNFGLTSASSFYFGKAPSDLSTSELVMLVAITKAPTIYSPYCSPDRLEKWGSEIVMELSMFDQKAYLLNTFNLPNNILENGVKCHLTKGSN